MCWPIRTIFTYVNGAHYNVFLYLAFGVWLLPVYGIYHLFSLNAAAGAANTFVLYWAAAGLPDGAGMRVMVRRLALRLEVPAGAGYAWLAFSSVAADAGGRVLHGAVRQPLPVFPAVGAVPVF